MVANIQGNYNHIKGSYVTNDAINNIYIHD